MLLTDGYCQTCENLLHILYIPFLLFQSKNFLTYPITLLTFFKYIGILLIIYDTLYWMFAYTTSVCSMFKLYCQNLVNIITLI